MTPQCLTIDSTIQQIAIELAKSNLMYRFTNNKMHLDMMVQFQNMLDELCKAKVEEFDNQ